MEIRGQVGLSVSEIQICRNHTTTASTRARHHVKIKRLVLETLCVSVTNLDYLLASDIGPWLDKSGNTNPELAEMQSAALSSSNLQSHYFPRCEYVSCIFLTWQLAQ